MSACVCICTYRLLWSNKHIITKAHPPKDIMKVFSKSSYLMPTPGVHFCIWRRWQRKANLTLESDGEWVVFFLNHCNCAYQPYLSFDFTSPSHSWLVFFNPFPWNINMGSPKRVRDKDSAFRGSSSGSFQSPAHPSAQHLQVAASRGSSLHCLSP